MRKWHRWISLPVTIFLAVTAFTGVWLEIERFFGEEEAAREKIRDLTSKHTAKVPVFQIEENLKAARLAVASKYPDAPLDKIHLQLKGDEPTATFYLAGKTSHKVVANLLTGSIVKEADYEEDSFILRLHSGEAIGDGGMVIYMFVGVGLFALVVSGLVIYYKMKPKNATGLRRIFWLASLSLFSTLATARADSPFYTDDPEFSPGWEIKLGMAAEHNAGGNVFATPILDLNYAVVPQIRLNLTLAGRVIEPGGFSTQKGFADTEFKVKWRFIDASTNSWMPSIGIAPKVFFPTSDQNRGLGDGIWRGQLPIQFGKQIGQFYNFAEVGYQMAFSQKASDYAYYGIGTLYSLNAHWAVGTELYGFTPLLDSANHQLLTTLGVVYTFNEHWSLKASVSRTLRNESIGGPNPSGVFYLVLNF